MIEFVTTPATREETCVCRHAHRAHQAGDCCYCMCPGFQSVSTDAPAPAVVLAIAAGEYEEPGIAADLDFVARCLYKGESVTKETDAAWQRVCDRLRGGEAR